MVGGNLLVALFGGKSAGVRVSGRVLAEIRKGNAARDAGRWAIAAAHYRTALSRRPDLYHIQVQYGHAVKEAGDAAAADAAYAAAAGLKPGEIEPAVHRAHLAKQAGRHDEAVARLVPSLGLPGAEQAAAELSDLLDAGSPLPAAALREAVAATGRFMADEAGGVSGAAPSVDRPGRPAGSPRPLVFDITDLVGHFRYQRLPTGIQRVQVETVSAALLLEEAGPVRVCAFVPGRGVCAEIPLPVFRRLAGLCGVEGHEAEWQAARAGLFWHLAVAGEIDLPFDGLLVNLGTSLWIADYFRFIRNGKATRRIAYIPFVHDLIPVVTPQFCTLAIVEEFTAWLAGVFEHADAFLTNSHSTARDLHGAADRIGRTLAGTRVEVARLDADLGGGGAPLPPSSLDRWGLRDDPFVLLVSTIEPRKNHVLALAAWRDLIRRLGPDKVPRLVCAGRDGWMNEEFYGRLAADPDLLRSVVVLHHLSDAELSLLYRSCFCTVYPSLYEGWGLPVSESLGHGRLAVIADNSALPEAGAGFAIPFASGDPGALAAAMERLIVDGDWRRTREAALAAGYRPRSWGAIASQIVSAARTIAGQPDDAELPQARPGRYHAVQVGRTVSLWPGLVNGEVFRFGPGWAWPEPDGCRVKAEGGELRMRLPSEPPEGAGPKQRLHVRLQGLATGGCSAAIRVGSAAARITLDAGERAWLALDLPPEVERPAAALSVTIVGDGTENVMMSIGGGHRGHALSVKVLGFLIWDADDPAGAAQAIGNIDRWRSKN